MNGEGFRVGYFWIEWVDDDVVSITNTHLARSALIRGGDLESLLSGIVECANLTVRDVLS